MLEGEAEAAAKRALSGAVRALEAAPVARQLSKRLRESSMSAPVPVLAIFSACLLACQTV